MMLGFIYLYFRVRAVKIKHKPPVQAFLTVTEGERRRHMWQSTFQGSCAANGTEPLRRPRCKLRSWHLTHHSDGSRFIFTFSAYDCP